MKNYIFKTTATMKPHNNKKWWIDSGIVREIHITAENAIKNKSEMYIDTATGESKQVGYVITGKTDFEDRDNYKWSTQYIDLWVTILTVTDTEF